MNLWYLLDKYMFYYIQIVLGVLCVFENLNLIRFVRLL